MIFGAAAVLAASSIASFNAAARTTQKVDSVTVVMIGTGTPVPNPRAAGPATAVVVGKRVFLFDAGANVERQLAAADLPTNGVEAVFFTHLHSDHVLGYPDLIFTSWVFGRKLPLRAFGPPGLSAMTKNFIAAFSDDIKVRTTGLEHAPPLGYRVSVKETRGGVVYDSGGVRITAFQVPHGAWPVALGYRIDAPGRSIVISGDTRPSSEVTRRAAGVDVLIHEVYSAAKVENEKMADGGDWPKYLASAHTSDVEIGSLAKTANPRMVILTHVISLGATDSAMVAAVHSRGYTGRVVVAHDLDRY
jgi:ribonuclease BN (tRNA processing enzyme)